MERYPNLLDAIDSVLRARGIGHEVGVVLPQRPGPVDLALAGTPALWRGKAGAPAAMDDLAQRPELASATVRRKRRRVELRLREAWVSETGEALERGADVLTTADLATGRRLAIDFCDPNATKAFHLGHLRNLALGFALAALARAGGAEVATQSHVGDIGRSMGEALAGYVTYHRGETPQSTGSKSDHFVGECYRRYVETLEAEAGGHGGPGDPALSREDGAYDDLAERLLARVLAGDPEATELWSRLRRWVVDGQEGTLARLGTRFDRCFYESDFLDDMRALVEAAVAADVVQRAPDGTVGYPTGHDEYPYLLLERADGRWTQYLRCLAVWRATAGVLEGSDSIQVMGSEWLALEAYGESLSRALDPDHACHPSTYVVHGMVTAGEEALSSSRGRPLLIDDVLDRLEAEPRLRALCDRHDRVVPRWAAATIAMAHVLEGPLAAPLEVSSEQLLDPGSGGGWTLLEAWVESMDPRHDGDPAPEPGDGGYRFLVLQSQLHRRFVAKALETLDVMPLMRFHLHLSRWFVATEPTSSLARAMRTVLARGLAALGLAGQASSPPSITNA